MIIGIIALAFICVGVGFAAATYYFYKYKHPPSPNAKFFSNIVLGHRGCNHPDLEIPENSLESMKFALEHKVDGLEFDVILSADNELMVFHDTHQMSRVCRSKGSVTSEEKISKLTRQQIQDNYHYAKGTDLATIPTIEELLTMAFDSRPDVKFFIEAKEIGYGKHADDTARRIVQVFQRWPQLHTQAIVASFNPIILYKIRKLDSKIVTGLIFNTGMITNMINHFHVTPVTDKMSFTRRAKLFIALKVASVLDVLLFKSTVTWIPALIGAGVMSMNNKLAEDLHFVKSLQNKGYFVNVWTVNNIAQKRVLQEMGNISITSDYLFDYSSSSFPLPESIRRAMEL